MTLYTKLMELREHQAKLQPKQPEHAPFTGLTEDQAAAVDETSEPTNESN